MDKLCRKCGKIKSTSDFNADTKRKDGFYPWCVECRREYKKKYMGQTTKILTTKSAQYTEQSKASHTLKTKYAAGEFVSSLLSRYGISAGDLIKIFREQRGKCAICKSEFGATRRTRFEIDHCHRTGKVRGLLCSGCNVGLGGFVDNVQSLWEATRYLKNPPAKDLVHRRSEVSRPVRVKNRYPDSTEYFRQCLHKLLTGDA